MTARGGNLALPADIKHLAALPVASPSLATQCSTHWAPLPHHAVQAFVVHRPSCFEAMWRSRSLSALVQTVAKGLTISTGADIGLMADLLHAMLLPPAPGQQPWFAASSERLQFVVFVLARIGGKAVAPPFFDATISHLVPLRTVDGVTNAIDQLHAAAQQLAQQPLLRQQLEVAAPALLSQADAASTLVRGWTINDAIVRPGFAALEMRPAALELMACLAQQLDPLALGLRLPGCYNPACTSLAGDSEADMALKTCAGCRIAR